MPEWLTVENVVTIGLAVVGLAAVIARFTPSESDDKIIQAILDFLNSVAQNRGKAVNKDDKRS